MSKLMMALIAACAAAGCALAADKPEPSTADKIESSTFVATHPKRFLPLPTDRAKTLEVFEENVYGRRPSLEGFRKTAKVVATREIPELNAVRKDVILNTLTPRGETNFLAVCYLPKSAKPVPAFVKICLRPVTGYAKDPYSMELYRKTDYPRVPLGDVLRRGFAVMMFHHGSVLPDNVSSLEGVERPADGWGAISTWALAASRCLDWLETEKAVDASRVAVIGHSRGGKTAIWAGVTDTRFALVISNDSGCSGARMNAVISKPCEKIADITKVFPYWFAPNYRVRWAGKEQELPFDNHQLLALVAPRLLAVGSAIDDYWACPQGEETSVRFASRAWADPLAVHYHCRDGMHTLSPEDWTQYMDFAAAHGWSGVAPDLRVGVASDVHVPVGGFERFRRTLAAFDARRVDAVLICGDLTQNGLVRELERFRDEWRRAFPGNRRSDGGAVVPLFIYGDHDTGGYIHKFENGEPPCKLHGIDKAAMEREVIPTVGSGEAWKRVFGEDWDFVQVRDVKGYRFILSHYYGTIHQQTPPGLEKAFAAATQGLDPARPFFFVQHRVFPETVDAFPYEKEWWCADGDASKKLLSRHPNAVGICGHAHSNLLNDGNLWKGPFAAVEVPSLHNLGLPRSTGQRRVFDEKSAQCLIMNVWKDRVVFERIDAMKDAAIAPEWTIDG